MSTDYPVIPGGGSGDVYPRGTTFPSTPAAGDAFYRSDANVLFTWNGTAWIAVESFADLTVYVDTAGNGDPYDAGAGGGATTLSAAWDAVPGNCNGNVTISMKNGTYTEAAPIELKGKSLNGPYTLSIVGESEAGTIITDALEIVEQSITISTLTLRPNGGVQHAIANASIAFFNNVSVSCVNNGGTQPFSIRQMSSATFTGCTISAAGGTPNDMIICVQSYLEINNTTVTARSTTSGRCVRCEFSRVLLTVNSVLDAVSQSLVSMGIKASKSHVSLYSPSGQESNIRNAGVGVSAEVQTGIIWSNRTTFTSCTTNIDLVAGEYSVNRTGA